MRYSRDLYSEILYIPYEVNGSSVALSSLSSSNTPSLLSSFHLIGFITILHQKVSKDIIRKIIDMSSCMRTLGVSIIVLIALRPIKMKYTELNQKLKDYIDIIITKWTHSSTATKLFTATTRTSKFRNVTFAENEIFLNQVFQVNLKERINIRNTIRQSSSIIINNSTSYHHNHINMEMMPYHNIIVINKNKNIIKYREGEALQVN